MTSRCSKLRVKPTPTGTASSAGSHVGPYTSVEPSTVARTHPVPSEIVIDIPPYEAGSFYDQGSVGYFFERLFQSVRGVETMGFDYIIDAENLLRRLV